MERERRIRVVKAMIAGTEKMDANALEKLVSRMLMPLGIEVYAKHHLKNHDKAWYLKTQYSEFNVCLKEIEDQQMFSYGWEDLCELLQLICAKTISFVLFGNDRYELLDGDVIAENPYLGAKSIEEVEIRKDLIFGQDNGK